MKYIICMHVLLWFQFCVIKVFDLICSRINFYASVFHTIATSATQFHQEIAKVRNYVFVKKTLPVNVHANWNSYKAETLDLPFTKKVSLIQ